MIWRFAAALVAISCLTGAPAFAQKADDYLGYCSEEDNVRSTQKQTCDDVQKEFKKWFQKAMRGDYQAQRNVAFAIGGREFDNKTAFRPNKITACAWRLVIIASGSPEVWSGDTDNVKIDCGKLDDVERAASQGQSAALITKIYGRR